MLKKKTIGIVVLFAGIIGGTLSLLSDIIGISCNKNFGYLQMAGIIMAMVLIIVGIILILKKGK